MDKQQAKLRFADLLKDFFDSKFSKDIPIEDLRIQHKKLSRNQKEKLLKADIDNAKHIKNKRIHLINYLSSRSNILTAQDNYLTRHEQSKEEISNIDKQLTQNVTEEKEKTSIEMQMIRAQVASMKDKLTSLEEDRKRIEYEYERYIRNKHELDILRTQNKLTEEEHLKINIIS